MKIKHLTILFIIFVIMLILTGCDQPYELDLKSDYYNAQETHKEGDFFDLPTPDTTGYAFVAWYYDSGYTNLAVISSIIDKTTLYGKWTNQNVNEIKAFNAAMRRAQGTHDSNHQGGQEELDTAQAQINALGNGDIKEVLQRRLNLDQIHLADELTYYAYNHAQKNNGKQEEIDYAQATLNKTDCNKVTLIKRLEEAQGYLYVFNAEKSITLSNVRLATDYINNNLNNQDHFEAYLFLNYHICQVWVNLAEMSKTQSVNDQARDNIKNMKLWGLVNEQTKADLLKRIDVVQEMINTAKKETDATNAVLKAEASVLQVDVNAAKLLVDALTNAELIKSLNHRIYMVQDKINYNVLVTDINLQASNYDITQAIIDALSQRANRIIDGQKKADLASRIGNLQSFFGTIANVTTLAELENALANPSINNINLLANIATNHPLIILHLLTIRGKNHAITFVGDTAGWQGHYVLDISGHSPIQIKNTILTGGDCAIRGIETTVFVDNVNVSGNEFWGVELNPGINGAYALVLQGGGLINTTEAFVRPTVREQGTFKKVLYGQFTRIEQTGNLLYYQDAYNSVDHLGIATTAVAQAETAVTTASVTTARGLVNILREASEKAKLNARLDVVSGIIAKETEAGTAVTAAEAAMTQAKIDLARVLVNALVRAGTKAELSRRLNIVQAKVSVTKAEAEKTQGNVDKARLDVTLLLAGDLKTNLIMRLDAVQAYLNKFAYVNNVADLEAALARPAVETINLTGNIMTDHVIQISRPVIISGHNYTLSFENDPAGWQGNYLLHVIGTTAVVIKDMKLTLGDAAICVDGAEVELQGVIDVSQNEFGGIELSKGESVVTDPMLSGKPSLINSTEEYGKPTVRENGVSLCVGLAGLFATIKDTEPQYYLVKDHINNPAVLEAVEKVEDTNLLVDLEAAQALVDTMTDAEEKANMQARLDAIVIEQVSLIIYFNTGFVLNEPNLVLVGFDANSYEGKEVTVLFTHSEGITLEYKLNKEDEWILLTDYFGSPTGFPLSSHAYLFQVTCTAPGSNTVGIEVRDTSGALMASKELTVTL